MLHFFWDTLYVPPPSIIYYSCHSPIDQIAAVHWSLREASVLLTSSLSFCSAYQAFVAHFSAIHKCYCFQLSASSLDLVNIVFAKNFVCWLLPLTLRVYCGIPLCARMYSNMRRVNRAPCPHMSGCNCIVEADPSVWESCLCPVIARWANILISCQIPCYQLNALIDPIRICDRTNIRLDIVVGHSQKQPRSFLSFSRSWHPNAMVDCKAGWTKDDIFVGRI